MKKSLLLMACIGVCACVLAACAKDKAFSAGTELTADEIRAYRERLQAERLAKEEAENAPEEAPDVAPDETVEEESDEALEVCYYTENGSVWHADRDCSYLKRSQNVLSGSVEGAAIAGKNRPCSSCAAAYQE